MFPHKILCVYGVIQNRRVGMVLGYWDTATIVNSFFSGTRNHGFKAMALGEWFVPEHRAWGRALVIGIHNSHSDFH